MRVLFDMNLSPLWVEAFEHAGVEACHWSAVGDPRASDSTILEWARDHGWVVLTHDLDFSRLLALTGSAGPSVVQLRSHDILPHEGAATVVAVLREHAAALARGAIVTIDTDRARARILPLE